MLGCMMLLTPFGVQAAQVENGAVYPVTTNELPEWPQGPDIYAETAVLMDADTGAILYNKGLDEKRYPASITKIMTLPDTFFHPFLCYIELLLYLHP